VLTNAFLEETTTTYSTSSFIPTTSSTRTLRSFLVELSRPRLLAAARDKVFAPSPDKAFVSEATAVEAPRRRLNFPETWMFSAAYARFLCLVFCLSSSLCLSICN